MFAEFISQIELFEADRILAPGSTVSIQMLSSVFVKKHQSDLKSKHFENSLSHRAKNQALGDKRSFINLNIA